MLPLAHGYTNATVGDGVHVVKSYHGPDARARREREGAALRALHGRLPVPPVIDAVIDSGDGGDGAEGTDGADGADGALTLGFVAGAHGQDLIDQGHADQVLAAYGRKPAWTERHGAMLSRCHELLEFCGRWQPSAERTRIWAARIETVAGWTGTP